MQRLILRHSRAPGDILVMSALVRDLAVAHPGRFRVSVDTPSTDVWRNNPYVVPLKDNADGKPITLSYGDYIPLAAREPIHFLTSFHRDFEKKTGVKVPLTHPTPDLHLTADEKAARHVPGRYWVLLAGGKLDFTTKHWVYARHQRVVDSLRGLGLGVVQLGGQGSQPSHYHPKLDGTLDLIGQTTLREMMQIVHHADGVVCTITFAMHLAAALGKPCVVTAGGREEWWWEAYHRDNPGLAPVARKLAVSHRYLHTVGRLDCCLKKGCWRNKVLASERDKSFCVYPKQVERGQTVPLCMDMITAEKVVEGVASYYLDGTLQPPEGMMLPPTTDPTLVDLPDGRRISLTVREAGLAPFVAAPPQSPPELAAPLAVHQFAPAPAAQPAPPPGRLIDAPEVGGRLTFFVLCYGDYPDMHRR